MPKLIFLLVAAFAVGCATAPIEDVEESRTFEEWDQIYMAEDRKIQKEEELVSYIKNCHEAGHVMFYRKHLASRIGKQLIDRHGVVHLPRHSSLMDFSCVSSGEARLIIEQLLGRDRHGRRL